MAKITTKKPGQAGATSPKNEIAKPPVSNPGIEASTPIETSAVPAKELLPTQPKLAQVKVVPVVVNPVKVSPVKIAQRPEVKIKNFSSPPLTPLPQTPKSKSSSLIVAFGGIVLILLSLSKLTPSTPKYDSEFLPADPTAREMLVRDDPAKMAVAAWKNEEPGIFGRFFRKLCLGYAKSDGCSDAPLHPFEKVAEQMGIKLSFEKEEDKKVIEQTIEHSSRAFTFGK